MCFVTIPVASTYMAMLLKDCGKGYIMQKLKKKDVQRCAGTDQLPVCNLPYLGPVIPIYMIDL